MFGGTLKMILNDGSVVEQPFWNRFYKSPDGQYRNKRTKMKLN